jgi:hypothetical protein
VRAIYNHTFWFPSFRHPSKNMSKVEPSKFGILWNIFKTVVSRGEFLLLASCPIPLTGIPPLISCPRLLVHYIPLLPARECTVGQGIQLTWLVTRASNVEQPVDKAIWNPAITTSALKNVFIGGGVTMWLRILQISNSNLGLETCNPDCFMSWFSSIPQAKCPHCILNWARPLPSTYLPTDYSQIFLTSVSVLSEMRAAL